MVTLSQVSDTTSNREVAVDLNSLSLERISVLDQCIKSLAINPLLNYVFGLGVVDFFRKVSGNHILKNLKDGPGSWKSMLAHYDAAPRNVIDHLVNRYISFPSGLRNRQKIVISALAHLIETYGKDQPLYLVGIGSGSGNNTMQAIKLKRSSIQSIKVQLFDLNEEALNFGRSKSQELGLEKEIEFIHSNATQVESRIGNPPQIIEMIGLIEYLSDQELLRLFESVRRFRNAKSSIVISSISEAHGIDRFLRRTLNFDLNYRSPQKVLQLLSEFGYKRFNVFPEPTGIFSVIVGHTS